MTQPTEARKSTGTIWIVLGVVATIAAVLQIVIGNPLGLVVYGAIAAAFLYVGLKQRSRR